MIMPGRNEPGEGVYEFIILYQVNYYTAIILFLVYEPHRYNSFAQFF